MYIELHCHSAYSFLDGASLPEELAAQAETLGYRALALTDHDGLYGAMEFAQQVKGRGMQAITGAEVTLEDETHLTLLAENPAGYAHLSRLLSVAHLSSERLQPRLARRMLKEYAEGLIVLSGCRESEIARAIDRGDMAAAAAAARRYRDWFGRENFFIELQQNAVQGDTARIRRLVELAQRLELPVVATGNVHYHRRARHRLQDTMVAIRHRTTLDDSHQVRRANSEFYLKKPELMAHRFRALPEAANNTLLIAERCQAFDITHDLGYSFPDFRCRRGIETVDEALEQLCWELLAQRYANEETWVHAEARQRLREELALVRHHRLAGFFLVYHDLMELAVEVAARIRNADCRVPSGRRIAEWGNGSVRNPGKPVRTIRNPNSGYLRKAEVIRNPGGGRFRLAPGRGRGSSVASILCYLTGLSPVDPIRTRLKLGRFLNKELSSVPDIDLDFPREIREELIREVHRRYGEEHVAMVATFPTYRIRSAVREIGKALGLPAEDVDRLARLSENGRADTVEEEMRRLPGFEKALADTGEDNAWRHLIERARELRGFPRHLSQHVGGMIISSRPLVEMVPIERSAMEGRLVCQWDKDSCDDARFIKIDFLALGMLSAVEECLDWIEANDKPPVDLSRIDFEDKAVYDRICTGDTVGVFQIESRAQMQMLPRTQPRNLDDLAVEVAIVRPGPIVGGAVNPYVRRREALRRGRKGCITYEHPLLQPVLEETLGVLLYQDQVLGVCQALAGFSVERAEALRRAMSRRRSHEAMAQFQEEFIEGARRKGVHPRTAARVFEKILGFSEYGFPKAHAAAFAVLAYQSAWLCHYYPAEFVAALLNNQPMGFYPRDVLIKDAQWHGVRFLRPDVNRSSVRALLSGNTVRLGLATVAGIGEQAAAKVVAERKRGGRFLSLPDFARRVALPCGAVESLIQVGAFDGFGLERRPLLWQLGLLARAQGWTTPSGYPPNSGIRRAGGGSLVARRQTSLSLPTAQDMVPLRPVTAWERMLADYRLMELSPDSHPLGLLRSAMPKGMATSNQLRRLPHGRMVQLAGLVVTRQRPGTAKGFLFLLAEDEFGLVNVVISPTLYEKRRAVVRGEPLILLRGTVQHRDGNLNLIAVEALPLIDFLCDSDRPLTQGSGAAKNPSFAFLEDLRRATPAAHQWR